MTKSLKQAALEHLEELMCDPDPRFAKSGEEFMKELVRDYWRQPDEAREGLRLVYRDWLQSQELGEVEYAISLIGRLNIQSERVLLEEMLEQIEKGQSNLPRYFKEFIEPALEDLKANQKTE